MQILGIVAEYNPLHRGHLYQLEEGRRLSGAEGVIVAMSGSFTQRGEAALLDKYRRTRAALEAGADMVLELPPAAACGSAENFAMGGIGILKAAGCVTALSFGTECGDLPLLKKGAEALDGLSDSGTVKEYLKQGHAYPKAVSMALRAENPQLGSLLAEPNDLLALEYLKAAKRLSWDPEVCPVKRQGAGHRDPGLPEKGFSSGSALRAALLSGSEPAKLLPWMPEEMLARIDYCLGERALSLALTQRLLELRREGRPLTDFEDVSPDLAARIEACAPWQLSFRELTETVVTRAFSAARVRRALLHILLHISAGEGKAAPKAIKILGLRQASPVPALVKKTASLPLITKTADADPVLVRDYCQAAELYNYLVYAECGLRLPSDHKTGPVII